MFKSLKFYIFILLLVIGVAIFYIFKEYGNRGLYLNLNATSDEVMVGVPFDLKVEFGNQSSAVLKNVALTLYLPEGMAFLGKEQDDFVETKNFGDIGEGSLMAESYRLVVLKDENSFKKIKAVLNYSSSSLTARFEKTKEKEIFSKSFGISIELVGPQKVSSAEEFDLDVVYRNLSEIDFKDLEFKIDYPPSFSFISSSLKPDKDNNLWFLGDLRKGSEGNFSIKGSIVGPENSSFDFKTSLKTALEGRTYDLGVKDFPLAISASPLSLNISLNEKQDYVSKLNDELNYVLSYVNNTDIALRDVVIRAQLIGELFDFNALETNALWRSSNNTLIWNSSNSPELNFLSPHTAGFVKFKIKTKGNYFISRLNDKNFTLKISAEIESPTIPDSVNASKTFNVVKSETKVSGRTEILSKAYFRDADSGILNKGDLPLKVGRSTNFTIHWFLKNYASDVSNLEVRAALAEGIKFSGVSKSDFGTTPFYEEKSNQIVWFINKMPANKGIVDQPAEAVFQVEVTPLASQIGKYMPLLGQTLVKAIDDFTSLESQNSALEVDSRLADDPTVDSRAGVVQP